MTNAINVLKPSGCFEIQKVIGISTIHGNCKSYQVQWAPTWISGAHLIGCEDLIEQFEQEQTKEEVNIKIEIPDEQGQEEIERNSKIDTVSNQADCEITDLAINNEEIMLARNLHTDYAAVNEFQDFQSQNRKYNYSPNITNQDNVRLKVNSLDSIIQQISNKKNSDYSSRRTLHPDFQKMQIDTEIKMDIEADIQEQLSSNLVDSITAGENSNCVSTKAFLLKDVQNFADLKGKPAVPGKSFGNGKRKKKMKYKVENMNLSNIGESLMPSKSKEVKTTPQRMDGERNILQCYICNKVFSAVAALENHTNCVYECIVCLGTFESEKGLKRHELKLHSACNICKIEFSNMEKLKVHIERHKTMTTNPLQCSYCGKINSSKQNHERHERVHTGERPFKCNICQKAFKIKPNLKRHHSLKHEKKPT